MAFFAKTPQTKRATSDSRTCLRVAIASSFPKESMGISFMSLGQVRRWKSMTTSTRCSFLPAAEAQFGRVSPSMGPTSAIPDRIRVALIARDGDGSFDSYGKVKKDGIFEIPSAYDGNDAVSVWGLDERQQIQPAESTPPGSSNS